MSNAHPSTGLQNSYKYHINYFYSTINNNYKTFFMLYLTEHEISTTHKNKITEE